MSRNHSHRGLMLRQERQADRLRLRADQLARRSARSYGVVVSLAGMAELRHTIADGMLPKTIRKIGKVGLSAEAYAVDFNGRELVAVYDRRGQSIATFLRADAAQIAAVEGDRVRSSPIGLVLVDPIKTRRMERA